MQFRGCQPTESLFARSIAGADAKLGLNCAKNSHFELLSQFDFGIRYVSINLRSDIVEMRLSPFVERTPKPVWLLRPESSHIEDSIVVLILEGA